MSYKKMWGGRFAEETSGLVEEYTESVSFDRALYDADIAGSKAHARMLAKQGVLTAAEAETLIKGLEQVRQEIEQGRFTWKRELEDVHMNIESRLTQVVGELGKKLHTGRSRNDQVALDFRLFVSENLREWQALCRALAGSLLAQARERQDCLMPGYTHLQPAQPVSLSQHLLAYAWMFRRDVERMADADKRARVSSLGAVALAGTTYPLDPAFVAEQLDMAGHFANSMDAVSDRDFVLEAVFCASVTITHLSRLCEDIILWANPSLGFIRLPDAYATGSSVMPQKKNPDVAELMRGKSGRVYGALFGLFAMLKGLPMTYNRDLQEDKEHFLDAAHTLSASLRIMAGMISALDFNPERMREALARGFVNATELADYLVSKGIPFREAHHLTGKVVALAERKNRPLEGLTLTEFHSVTPAISADLYPLLTPEAAVARRNTPGGTGPAAVAKQIQDLEKWLAEK